MLRYLPFLLLLSVWPVPTENIWIELETTIDHPVAIFSFPIPEELMPLQEGFSYGLKDGGATHWLQIGAGNTFWALLDKPLKAGERPSFEIVKEKNREKEDDLTIYKKDGGVMLAIQEHPIARYQEAPHLPEGAPEYYTGSGFLHPLYAPGGQQLTDGFPIGHTHQHGIFHAFVNSQYKGEELDFWNQQDQTATTKHIAIDTLISGPVFGEIKSRVHHLKLPNKLILEEQRTIRAYNYKELHIIDIFINKKNQSSDTLFIEKYLYGGLGIRGSREWNHEDKEHFTGEPVFLTSEGLDRISSNHTTPNWVSFKGVVEEEMVGMLSMGSPDNFRFPQPVRVHPKMPYFCFAPMVEEGFAIAPGQRYSAAFRIIAYQGEQSFVEMDKLWKSYQYPIKVSKKSN